LLVAFITVSRITGPGVVNGLEEAIHFAQDVEAVLFVHAHAMVPRPVHAEGYGVQWLAEVGVRSGYDRTRGHVVYCGTA
jgi:hypothetical protein